MDQHPQGSDPAGVARRISELIAAGRPGAARLLLDALRRMLPASACQAELAARLALAERQPEIALAELDAAIAYDPAAGALRKLRAEVRHSLGDLPGAAAEAAEAVVLEPDDPAAKALLGLLLLELNQPDDARACLHEACGADPANPTYCQALAEALERCQEPVRAADALARGIAAAPGRVELRNAAICLAVRQSAFAEAIDLAAAARRDGVVDACTLGLLGHALSSLGRHEVAAEAYTEALKLGPEDRYVRHLVAAAGAVPSASRAPADYLRTVFDGYADRFESHLIELGYRVPALVRQALLRQLPGLEAGQAAGPLLDLGCGTGLIAVVLSDLPVAPLHGIDISPRMLAEARAKNLYAVLHEADLMAALAASPRHYPIITAADVLCYFGALEPLFAAVHACLLPGGLFIASAETRDAPGGEGGGPGWALGRMGRYAHTTAYVLQAAAAAGLRPLRVDAETQRREAGAAVPGLLATFARSDDAP